VHETVLATRQANGLRKSRRAKYDEFLDDLALRGCAALDYRVTGPSPLDWLCVRHLRGSDRVVVVFESAEDTWIVLIGPHNNDDPGEDVYTTLYNLVGVEPDPNQQRTKPSCCDKGETEPPIAGIEIIDELAHRARQIAKQRT
jgi:hypothetical protein